MHDPRPTFDDRFATIYDLVYQGRGKDFEAEAAVVARLVINRRPDASSLLDVACGTGLHLRAFTDLFTHVEGVELAEDMLAIARPRLPEVTLHLGDMRDFELGRTFDAVTCLFAAIGHMRTVDELAAAVARFTAHLEPGGVLVVEPWFFPDSFTPGHVGADIVRRNGYTIARVSHTTAADGVTTLEAHFVVATEEGGVRHFTNTIVNSLFSREQYETALRQAGCVDIEYRPDGFAGRFVAVRGAA